MPQTYLSTKTRVAHGEEIDEKKEPIGGNPVIRPENSNQQ